MQWNKQFKEFTIACFNNWLRLNKISNYQHLITNDVHYKKSEWLAENAVVVNKIIFICVLLLYCNISHLFVIYNAFNWIIDLFMISGNTFYEFMPTKKSVTIVKNVQNVTSLVSNKVSFVFGFLLHNTMFLTYTKFEWNLLSRDKKINL